MSEVIPHWLDKQADLSPDGIAIETPEEKWTFLQLKKQSRNYAMKLAAHGVTARDHVAILSTNCIEMVVAVHALSYLGAVAVMINTRLSPSEIAYQLEDANVSCLLYRESLDGLANDSVEAMEAPVFAYGFKAIDRQEAVEVNLKHELELGELFTIIYTSGTTGFPKGVEHTFGNHWWSAVSSALNLGLSDQDKWLSALPLFHVGGLSVLVKSVVYGMPVYLLEKFEVDKVHHAIMAENVTIVSVVSVMLERLIEKLGSDNYPDQFRCMLLGGGPASATLLGKAKQHGIPIFQTYGMTETSSQIVTLSPKYALEKLGSAGKALVPAQMKIVKENRISIPYMVGEIFVKGPMVTKGYYNNPSANEKTFLDGWLGTGDLGYVDEDGFLYVKDRRTDLIISGGENIYPAEIEAVLGGMEGIREAGVIGMEDSQWGQVPAAFVVKTDASLSEAGILDFCSKRLAKYKVPKRVYFIDALPRNASNKIVRQKLKELL
ncbi:o-succinylbenzoate--CoA ligase [Sediminibacillus massiliensis]|uniref:o-succinylbenzoate--CoA ligase n=1 Tax=Sediminibacillus massiliensis TaxID=1926277 RepID=UPI000988315C|nr:o-succinylbenzoate--CoA ligase [Sediminibacillus massiliensis]